jgi:hypothetical protein
MSSHVGTVTVGGFPPEKEATAEERGGQHSSNATYPNFPFEQDKSWCMLILSYPLCPLYFMFVNVLCTYI